MKILKLLILDSTWCHAIAVSTLFEIITGTLTKNPRCVLQLYFKCLMEEW